MNVLIVKLGALGDIIHAIPAAAALRSALPDARIDWVVDAKHRGILDLVSVLDRIVPIEGRTLRAWTEAVSRVRQTRYDVALDLQGLMKSAVLARASGAARVAGFSIWHLREKSARPFYSETGDSGAAPPDDEHVIYKNLRLLRVVGIDTREVAFPIARVPSAAAAEAGAAYGAGGFALINAGAAWPNKRWPPGRFGEVAAFLREIRGLPSLVLWGPGEQELAWQVVEASSDAARVAPATTIGDLAELSRLAALVVSGDTGPLQIAAAVGTPAVAIFGPTNPGRNGPWSPDDVVVSRYPSCACHYDRRCHNAAWCLESVTVAEVCAAIQQRLPAAPRPGVKTGANDD
ncbi:MAG TPA: glycosyltransferase family 9 protein [Vicinamibacterales bacterium]|nr:glycosyltransferase family 9 protein [Vicinamibacterales bacterium]